MLKPHTEELRWINTLSPITFQFPMRQEISFREFWLEILQLVQILSKYVCIHLWPTVRFQSYCLNLYWLVLPQGNTLDNLCLKMVLDINRHQLSQEDWKTPLLQTLWEELVLGCIVGKDQEHLVKLQFLPIEAEFTIDKELLKIQLPNKTIKCPWYKIKEDS